jgi:hypothetical protein
VPPKSAPSVGRASGAARSRQGFVALANARPGADSGRARGTMPRARLAPNQAPQQTAQANDGSSYFSARPAAPLNSAARRSGAPAACCPVLGRQLGERHALGPVPAQGRVALRVRPGPRAGGALRSAGGTASEAPPELRRRGPERLPAHAAAGPHDRAAYPAPGWGAAGRRRRTCGRSGRRRSCRGAGPSVGAWTRLRPFEAFAGSSSRRLPRRRAGGRGVARIGGPHECAPRKLADGLNNSPSTVRPYAAQKRCGSLTPKVHKPARIRALSKRLKAFPA